MYTLRGGNASTQFHGGEQKKKTREMMMWFMQQTGGLKINGNVFRITELKQRKLKLNGCDWEIYKGEIWSPQHRWKLCVGFRGLSCFYPKRESHVGIFQKSSQTVDL